LKVPDYPIPQILLEIVKHFPERRNTARSFTTPELRDCCDRLRTLLPDYSLSNEDYILIAVLFERFLQRGKRVDARDLAERLYPENVKRLQVFQQIRRLVAKGLLEIRGMRRRGREQNTSAAEKFSIVTMVESEVLFRDMFLQQLLGDVKRSESKADQPFVDNRDYLESWFAYIKALKSFRDASSYIQPIEGVDNSEEESQLRDAKATLDARLALPCGSFPLQELVEEEALDEKERDVIVYLLSEEMEGHNCTFDEMVDLISDDQFDRHQNRAYFDGHSRLVSRGIVEMTTEKMFVFQRSDICLAPDVSRRLLSRTPESDRERLELVMQGQSIFELAAPQQSFDNLILPVELKDRLETAVQRYRNKADLRLREWGIDRVQPGVRVNDNDEAPLLMLFSGASGTGKTFAAGAFAQKLGKELLITDVSRILSSYVGESEQNVSRLFRLFDRLVRRMGNPPVLLLNECDQFLSTRGNETKAVDRMYHQMQNLFLEAFERMRGILIATTNLAEGIDPAFSRRFHLKLEFPMPDVESRLSLWRTHLPKTLPIAKDVNLGRLAKDYEFSGGQISLVVRNAAIVAAVRGGEVTMADLSSACKTESLGARKVTGSGCRPMGFAA